MLNLKILWDLITSVENNMWNYPGNGSMSHKTSIITK